MDHVAVGGAEIPKLGVGTSRLTGQACVGAVGAALDLGYRHVDTAQFYDNEDAVGEALKNADVPRQEVFLTTKVWRSNLRYDDVLDSVEASLDRLDVEYVDLLLVHWPHPRVPIEDTLAAMERLREEGTVRHLGVSNFTRSQLAEAIEVADAPIVADQVRYNPYAEQSSLRAFCVERDVALTAYSPLAKGKVTDDETLAEIGRTHDKTAAQVALRWLLQQANVVAIPRSSDPVHLRANLDVFDFELSDEAVRRIDGLSGGVRAWLRNAMPALVRSFPL